MRTPELYHKNADGIYQQVYTTSQAAAQAGVTRANLLKIIQRHPHTRPSLQGDVDLFWTLADIDAVKSLSRKVGRPANN